MNRLAVRLVAPAMRAALAGVMAVALAACSSGGAAPATTTTVTLAPAPPTTACATQAPPVYAPVAGIDPYSAIGARQHPGPAMSTLPLPDQPVSIDVQATPDPDQLAAARQPDGVPGTLDSTIAPQPTAPPETVPPGQCWQSTDGSDGP